MQGIDLPVDGRLYIYVKVHMVDSQVRTSVHRQGHIVALARQCHPHPLHLHPELPAVRHDRLEGLVTGVPIAGSRLTSTRGRNFRRVPAPVMFTILHPRMVDGSGPGSAGRTAAQGAGRNITAKKAESATIPSLKNRTISARIMRHPPSPSHYTTVPSQNAPLCAFSGKVRQDYTTL
jgi:hypothetical protein